jgi:hypothetical protein
MKLNFFRIIKQKSGVAIMSVMLFFMVMMLMVGALTISSEGNLRVSGVSAQNTAAYYAAEAGITFVVSDFRRIIGVEEGDLTQAEFVAELNNFITNHGSTRVDLSSNGGAEAYSLITFRDVAHNTSTQTFQFTVVSTGVVNDQTRTLETFVDLDYSLGAGNRQGFAVKHAVLVRNTFTTANNFTINLSPAAQAANPTGRAWVATTSLTRNAINFGRPGNYLGTVELQSTANNNVTNAATSQISKTLNVQTFTQLDFEPIRTLATQVLSRANNNIPNITGLTSGSNINPTVAGTYTIPGGSYYVPQVRFNANNVTINANQDVFIVTDSLSFLGNVSFTGTGEVKFYVRRNMASSSTFSLLHNLNNGIVGRSNNPHLFLVYVDETSPAMTITPGNNSIIFGSFMFNNSNLNFSNNVAFGGYLMTGGLTVNLSNNADVFTALYYAPNANVTVKQNGIVRGAIIANNVTMENNATVQYEPAFLTNFPFAVESPIVDTTRVDGVHSIVFRIHRTTEQ